MKYDQVISNLSFFRCLWN